MYQGIGHALCQDIYGRGLPTECGDATNPNVELDKWNYFDPKMFLTPENMPYVSADGKTLYTTPQPQSAAPAATQTAQPAVTTQPQDSAGIKTLTAPAAQDPSPASSTWMLATAAVALWMFSRSDQ